MLFDEKGYLKPYEIIPTTLETFKTYFVFNEQRDTIVTPRPFITLGMF